MLSFVIKGDIVFTEHSDKFTCIKDGYVLCKDGICQGVVTSLNENKEFLNARVIDHTGKIIIPGFIDTHIHSPQYGFRGMGMDMPLMDWLQTYTFPEESNYENLDYAKASYNYFVNHLKKSATTRAAIFGTIHLDSTLYLCEEIEKTGLCAYVGKVNMNQNACDKLNENTATSLSQTEEYITKLQSFKKVKPIITPRFIPSCSEDLLAGLGKLAKKYDVAIQSHLSENLSEIAFVKKLFPNSKNYASVYEQFNLLDNKTIMAHCVHLTDEECELLKEKGSIIAHSPQSNTNLISGVAPLTTYLKKGIKVGLATDVAGGASLNLFRSCSDALYASKLRHFFMEEQGIKEDVLSLPQVFYMATKGGGAFFEHGFGQKTGSFEKGYAFDALVIEDESLTALGQKAHAFGIEESMVLESPLDRRIERLFYLADERNICEKYVSGVLIR